MSAVADALRLLSDPTRLRLLHLLEREPLTVAELQEILDLGQSSISGHLGKLKQAGLLHDLAEGSSHRYRRREDCPPALAHCWSAARSLSQQDAGVVADLAKLAELTARRGAGWVERVAGALHREYAPGRSWEGLAHAAFACARLGRCIDVGAGDGATTALIAPRCTSLLCVEPSPAMTAAGAAATAALGLKQVRWEQARGEALPAADASADTVLLLQSLQYVEDPARTLGEAMRVLFKDGRLIVLTLAKHGFDEAERYGHRHRGFDATQLRRWTAGMVQMECHLLPAESRAPRFQPILFTAVKG